MIKKYIKSLCHIPYTWKHYIAILKLQYNTFKGKGNVDNYVINKLQEIYGYVPLIPFKFHDLDKIHMYLFYGFLGTVRIKDIHRILNKHHINNTDTDFITLLEAFLDWESAHYTKKDKGANGYFLIVSNKYNRSNEQMNELIKIANSLHELNKNIKVEPFIYEV